MINLNISARGKTNSTTDYSPLNKHGLQSKIQCQNGNGDADNPYKLKVSISNTNKSV